MVVMYRCTCILVIKIFSCCHIGFESQNANNACLLFLLHFTCHVSITHLCTENPTFVLSFIYMCDIIWAPAPLKICYLARNLKELHEPVLNTVMSSSWIVAQFLCLFTFFSILPHWKSFPSMIFSILLRYTHISKASSLDNSDFAYDSVHVSAP